MSLELHYIYITLQLIAIHYLKMIVQLVVFTVILANFCSFGLQEIYPGVIEDHNYWHDLARNDIKKALNIPINNNQAKNVIIFIGDGLGLSTITATRIYGKTESGHLVFEEFPHIAALKTYSADKYVPDSCSTATALFTGVKANYKTAGVDATVAKDDCPVSLNPEAQLDSILKWAQDAGKRTGFVTTTRVTHATPSALYAHTPNRKWECEAKMPPEAQRCKDIARQLIEDLPGKNINVIMGGGRQCLQSHVSNSSSDPIDTWACYSEDGRDLIANWIKEKQARDVSHKYVVNNEELQEIQELEDLEYVLGIFANGHLKMEHARDKGPQGMPSLRNMTEAAIKLLNKHERGYVLVVEGGMIDFAHHRGHARQALNEAMAFNDAIERTIELSETKKDETLIIVTSDHSHPLAISGYADRGSKITDIAQKSKMDFVPYTSLLYAIGGPDNYKYSVNDSSVVREDPSTVDTHDFNYAQQAGVLTDEVTHDGTDVLVYAKGPFAHLFHSVHEQTYVAYVMAYAARIGPYKDNKGSADKLNVNLVNLIVPILVVISQVII